MKRFAVAVIFLAWIIGCKEKDTSLFTLVSPDHSGIHFKNDIIDTDSFNVLDVENIYNGGGAGIGDFNNDGLQDVYFTGSLVSNKLYLNKGAMKFEDITAIAGVSGDGKWCRGIAGSQLNWRSRTRCRSRRPIRSCTSCRRGC